MNPQDLESRIAALEEKQRQRERQQITFPLDKQSVDILSKYLMRITGTVVTIGGASGNEFVSYVGHQDNLQFVVSENTFVPYTVNVTTNVFTVAPNQVRRFFDDMQVYVVSSDTVPAPLVSGDQYFVVNDNAEGTSFQLSATQGGAAINITDAGTGAQYIFFF